MSQSNPMPLWTEIGEKLRQDKSGAERQRLQKTISEKEEAARRALESGLSAEDSSRARREMTALRAASRIVDIVWHVARHAEKSAA